MSRREHEGDAAPYINVTPMIDILLVLLIIFMVASPLHPSRFKTLIPEPLKNEDKREPLDTNLRVDIDKEMRLQLNGEDAGTVNDTGRLSQLLAELFEKREKLGVVKFGTNQIEKTVFIKAPRSIKYGEVVKVIDGVKGAGAHPVGLQVDDLAQ